MYNPGKIAMHAVFFLVLTLAIGLLYREIMAGPSSPENPGGNVRPVVLSAQMRQATPYPYPPAATQPQRYLLDGTVEEVSPAYWRVDDFLVRWPAGSAPVTNVERGSKLRALVRPMSDGTYLLEEVIGR